MSTSNLKNREFQFDQTTVDTSAVTTVADAVAVIEILKDILTEIAPNVRTVNGADPSATVLTYYAEI